MDETITYKRDYLTTIDYLIIRAGGRKRFDRARKFFEETVPRIVKERFGEDILFIRDIGVMRHSGLREYGDFRARNYGFIVLYFLSAIPESKLMDVVKVIEGLLKGRYKDIKIILGESSN